MAKKGKKKVANTIGGISNASVHESIARNGGEPAVTQPINFDPKDDAVPRYLRWLEKFERSSRRVHLVIH